MKEDSLSNKAYIELRKKILSNQLISGTRLKEDEWAKKLDANRIAIREALTRLMGEQLIVQGEKGGFFVKTLTVEDSHLIRELREILEVGALRLVMHKIDEKGILELERICDDFSSMVERGYFGGACEADVKFHETLIEYAGNDKLIDLYKASNIPLFHQKLGKMQTHMDDYELTDQEHREIVSAIKEKNIHRAEEALVKHLIRGEVASIDLS
ncbi:GntR family transcriptional regulator [Dyadobacter frigoris]|uniref:GntR family transcriptional regulator n=1 Tax=Dyadobacter frigoris TaxID=2576211 RepID=A0A4U6CTP6_9BACT|nr:GntR family transcriptional regulator [Dyadobacter frigoris]TKT87962.1 GntR family transcriptional regulator [Dyadobacter frigoris]GLU52856.1 GntR family transcriptional regulator [Dyadobacter frigoris]